MKFNLFAASVHGRKYREQGLPCQDFAATLQFGDVQALALADGHGGKDYFRSDTGARLAVETAFEQIKIFCKDLTADATFSESGISNFEFNIVESWREKILADRDARLNTFESEPRWQTVSDEYKARFTSDDENIRKHYIPVAYGTTLICAVSIGTQVLIVQVGDGSCVVLRRDGEFSVPIPADEENVANVTASLCDEDAFSKFRHVVLNCDENSPVAIFLSSDGLDNCYPHFENEKYLFKFYRNTVIKAIINDGFASTANDLRGDTLPYMTERGSNDDISLAWLVTDDLNLLKAAVEESDVQSQTQSNVTPQTQSTVASQTQSTVNTQAQSTVAPQAQSTVTPQTQSTVAPQVQSTVTPQTQSTVAPQVQSTVTPQTQSTVTPQAQSTFTPQTQSTFTPQTQSTVTPQAQSTFTPQTQSTFTPQTQSTVTPQAQSTFTPQTQSAVAPQTQPTVAPQTQSTVAPQAQSTVASQAQSTVTPQTQSTVAPKAQSTVAPQAQSTVAPQAQSTVTPQAQSTVQPLTSPMVKPPPKVSPVHKAQDITILPPTVIPIDRKEPRS